MRTLTLTVMSLMVMASGLLSSARADELFSQDGLGSVFSAPQQPSQPATPTQPGQPPVMPQQPSAPQQPSTPQQPSNPQQPGAPRIIEKSQLADFIRAAGFQPKAVNETVQMIEVPKDKWTFPVVFVISPNNENLWIGVLLATVDENKISPRVLLALMELHNTYGPAHFSYSASSKRIDLNFAVKNNNLMPADLKATVNQLVDVAVTTAPLWSNPQADGNQLIPGPPSQPSQPMQPTQPTAPAQPSTPAQPSVPGGQSPSQPQQPQPQVQQQAPVEQQPVQPQQPQIQNEQPEQPQAPAQGGIVGKWGASPKEGMLFMLMFDADGKFVLFHKNPKGQESKSQGRYTQNGETLTLISDDGTKLTGKFTRKDGKTFVFTPSTSGDNLTFVSI